MKVIVAGGRGLIGRALTASLLKDGHTVTVLTRNPETTGTQGATGARFALWDGATLAGWVAELNDSDAVVNLTGENLSARRWSPQMKTRILDSRVKPGEALTQAIQQAGHKPQVVVQASAVGYYGPRGDEEITEAAIPGEDFLAQVCQAWEKSTSGVETLGIRRVVFRTGVILSTEGGPLPRMLLPFRLYAGGRIGSGKQWFPWIHLEDEVAAIRYFIDNPGAQGVFNLSAPNPVTMTELTRTIGRVISRPSAIPLPAFALKIAFGEMSIILLEGQREIPRRLLDMGFHYKFDKVEAALRDLLQ